MEIVRALALGAPLEYGEQRKLRHYSECETDTECRLERKDDESAVVAYCESCGTETGRW